MDSHTFHIQTFGCQMNANDSDWLFRALCNRGFQAGSFDDADVYVLMTCSIREKAEHKVYSEIGRIVQQAKLHGKLNVIICVGGCVAQQVGTALIQRFPQVRLLFGTDGIAQAPAALEKIVRTPRLRLSLLDFLDSYEERPDCLEGFPCNISAYVNIMQGCDNFCTYCIVPYVRGRQKSRSIDAIVEECARLAAWGTREITLLGQNVNAFGLDAGLGSDSFAKLLVTIAELPGIERLRFMTSHPKDMAPELIKVIGKHESICPRIHLPLQSGSDFILKRMNRKYTVAEYQNVIDALRESRSGIVFSTDIIVGFPGETEKDFIDTLRMVETVGYASSFSFVYSDRPKAKASLMPDKVARNIALERLTQVQKLQDDLTASLMATWKGQITNVLLEHKKDSIQLQDPEDKSALTDKCLNHVEVANEEIWLGKNPHGLPVQVSLPIVEGESWLGKVVLVVCSVTGRNILQGKAIDDLQ